MMIFLYRSVAKRAAQSPHFAVFQRLRSPSFPSDFSAEVRNIRALKRECAAVQPSALEKDVRAASGGTDAPVQEE